MPLAPAIAASLAVGLPTRTRSLWIDSVDVVLQPGQSGNAFGALIESVALTHAGPGAVSALTFTIEDPQIAMAIAEGAIVRLHNHARDWTEFLGFVQSWRYRPLATGRLIDVVCQGVEAILDWLIVGGLTIPAGTSMQAAVQAAYGNAVGTGGIPLRAFSAASASSQPFPIDGNWLNATAYALTFANTTLREAIRQILAAVVPDDPAFDGYFLETTVDMYAGLRVWYSLGNLAAVNDTLTVTLNQAAGPHEDLSHEVDAGGAIHNVWVAGGNAAGTGLVTDGSGKPGKTGIINDPTILTTTQRNQVGKSYLREVGSLSYRGTVVASEPSWESLLTSQLSVSPVGTELDLTNPQAGLGSALRVRITQVRRRYLASGKTVWTIAYGGNPPRATTHIRRLTKDRLR